MLDLVRELVNEEKLNHMVKIDLCHVVISTVNPILFFFRSVVCTMQYIECHWQSRHVYTDASTTLSRETARTAQLSSVSSTLTTTYLSTTATSPAVLLRSLLSSKSGTPQSKASLSTPSTLSLTTKYLPSKTTQKPSPSATLVSYGKLLIAY